MEIVKSPNVILKTKCNDSELNEETLSVLDQMYNYVKDHSHEAVGLAAPQIGKSLRCFVIRYKDQIGHLYQYKMLNPRIIKKPGKTYVVPGGEGCLSEPGIHVEVPRAKEIILSGYDCIQKKVINEVLKGFPAAIAQHEMDHLNGILLEDYK